MTNAVRPSDCSTGRRRARPSRFLFTAGAYLLLTEAAYAGVGQTAQRPDGPRVFLDCPARCDDEFLRKEITVVDYVRDRQDADVHVLVTSQPTGGGGVEYTVQFIGLSRFANVEHILKRAVEQTSTADERRRALSDTIKLGLVRYIADTTAADSLQITFAPAPVVQPSAHDPWNLWVFRTTFSGTLAGERSNTGRSIRVGASANRTSDEWRFNLTTTANYRDDVFRLSENETFESISKGFSIDLLTVKSLTPHWSAGIVGTAGASTFFNYDFRMRAAAGLEYNVFPYAQSTTRILTFQYTVGLNSFDYREETIFNRLSERLVDHRIGTLFTMLQPWGSAGAEAAVSQFVTKPDKYNLSLVGQTNLRVARGFSLNAVLSVSRTHDQLYLPKAGATVEEILVREQQLATSYRYSTVFGVTYTFGSIFNNVVNPRFGRAGDELSEF